MKFREEVFAKIFTYITVMVLLGVILFVSWLLYGERGQKEDWKQQAEVTSASLDRAMATNAELEAHAEELESFQSRWEDYAALKESPEAQELYRDLQSRPDLIPRAALTEVLEYQGIGNGETEREESEEEPEVRYSFAGDGAVFLPVSLEAAQSGHFLVYATAVSGEVKQKIELLYAVDFSLRTLEPERDEDGKIVWSCLAYQAGDGWKTAAEEEG